MRYLVIVALALVFTVAGWLAGVVAFAALCLAYPHYAGEIFHALDVTLGAMLGYDSGKTVSGECATRDSAFCRGLCKFLSWALEPDHCNKQKR